jgi:hypothetical protein
MAWFKHELCGGPYAPSFVSSAVQWPVYLIAHTRGHPHPHQHPQHSLYVHAHDSDTDTVRWAAEVLYPLLLRTTEMLQRLGYRVSTAALSCTFVACDVPRRLPPPKEVLGPGHVNGGVAFGSFDASAVTRYAVMRTEDACKVAIHELLHVHDVFPPTTADVDVALVRALREQHRIEWISDGARTLGVGEAFTDALACYLHTVWWVLQREQPNGGCTAVRRAVSPALKRMAAHMDLVARRVAAHCLAPRARASGTGASAVSWREGTHAFAYYVGKLALWMDLAGFLAAFPPGAKRDDCGSYMSAALRRRPPVARIRISIGMSIAMVPPEQQSRTHLGS